MSARLNDTSLCESKFGFLSTCAPAQALPRPEDLVAGLAMAEHEGAVYEDSMVRCCHYLGLWGFSGCARTPWCAVTGCAMLNTAHAADVSHSKPPSKSPRLSTTAAVRH